MKSFSQRDPAWKNQQLGTSATTIGSSGCTITCLGMLAEMTPPQVNDALKRVNGYANGNLVIWDKINAAIPSLSCLERSTTYNNEKVTEAIQQYGGCLVEVNGAPIQGTKHWVLYIGNKQLVDPWDGQTKPTSAYQAIGFASISVKSTAGQVTLDSATFELLVTKATKYDHLEAEGYVMKADHEQAIQEKDQRIAELEAELATANKQVAAYKGEVTKAQTELTACQTNLAAATAKPVITKPTEIALGEVMKEILRWAILGAIPVLLTYLGTINAEWAITATALLRLVDKALHEMGKQSDQKVLAGGITRF